MAIPASELWNRVQRDLSGRSNIEQMAILRRHLRDWPSQWKGPYRELQQRLRKLLSKLEGTESVKSAGGQRDPFHVPREGHAQFALLGLPNSGKSALVSTLTSARTPVTDFPFATQLPIPGSLRHKSAAIQLIDTPALVSGTARGEGAGLRLLNLVRDSDALGIVVDLSGSLEEQVQVALAELDEVSVLPIPSPVSTLLHTRGKGGVVFTGVQITQDEQDIVRRMLGSEGIHHAEIRVFQGFSHAELEAQIQGVRVLPTIVIGTKIDLTVGAHAEVHAPAGGQFAYVATSFLDETHYDELRDLIFWILGLIRVYVLDKPSPDAAKTPMVLRLATRMAEFTRDIRSGSPRVVRVWGPCVKHQGQPVSSQYLIQADDVIFVDR